MRRCCLVILAMLAAGSAWAADITVGLAAAPTSSDPHFHNLNANNTLARLVFGALLRTDAALQPKPDLAASVKLLDDRSWQFTLRPDVRFHDGTPFTAADVVFSLCRARPGAGPTQSFTHTPRLIDRIDIADPHSIVLHTAQPEPTFGAELASFAIVSAHSAGAEAVRFSLPSSAGEDACGLTALPVSSAFDNGGMANGTGPYRLRRYVAGEPFVLEADPGYHGDKPHWGRATFKPVSNAGARIAGLLSGDFDLIENPSAQDLPTLKSRGGFAWVVTPSDRIVFLQPDIGRARSPLATVRDGSNPLADPRVREAISLSIDRTAITGRLMGGMGVPADQYLAPGLADTLPNPPPRRYDPVRARALLAEAGHADDITLTLSATNDRYIDDAKVAQALGQYLSRAGIRTTVDAMSQTLFFPRRAHRDFSLAMGGWGFDEPGSVLRTWIAGTDQARALGQSNYGGYANPALDALLIPALAEMDAVRRTDRLNQATMIALRDNAMIPLYWETTTWAFKDRYIYTGRIDQMTDIDGLQEKVRP